MGRRNSCIRQALLCIRLLMYKKLQKPFVVTHKLWKDFPVCPTLNKEMPLLIHSSI